MPGPETSKLEVRWLGRIGYQEALALQDALVEQRVAGECNDVLLLLEHEPVYTMGRALDQSSLGNAAQLPHPVIHINRGGQATYHGPGQLVGYPILDLRNRGHDLQKYLRGLEHVLIRVLESFGIVAERREKLTGVWVEDRKIASIGVGVRQWISMHGFALNVSGDLKPFDRITPCGISGVRMTSIEREAERAITFKEVADKVAQLFGGELEAFISASPSLEVFTSECER